MDRLAVPDEEAIVFILTRLLERIFPRVCLWVFGLLVERTRLSNFSESVLLFYVLGNVKSFWAFGVPVLR